MHPTLGTSTLWTGWQPGPKSHVSHTPRLHCGWVAYLTHTLPLDMFIFVHCSTISISWKNTTRWPIADLKTSAMSIQWAHRAAAGSAGLWELRAAEYTHCLIWGPAACPPESLFSVWTVELWFPFFGALSPLSFIFIFITTICFETLFHYVALAGL